jgi:thiosulfate dehydrogenase [quinone] large subunit
MVTGYDRTPSVSEMVDRAGGGPGVAERRGAAYVLAGLRVVVGFTFLWAFLDKLFGWGFATPSERSWLNGGSPTKGFLSGAEGLFRGFWTAIAGDAWTNWAFMLGLAAIGVALLLGVGMRVAAVAGALMYVMMWAVVLPPPNNPIVDDHILGALVVVLLALTHAGDTLGLGRWWKSQPVVRRNRWLI